MKPPPLPPLGVLLIGLSCLLLVASCGKPKVGVGCTANGDCADICLSHFAGGLCTLRCGSTPECPGNTICTDTENPSGGVCLYPCTSTPECDDLLGATGYICDSESELGGGDVMVCVD